MFARLCGKLTKEPLHLGSKREIKVFCETPNKAYTVPTQYSLVWAHSKGPYRQRCHI